MNSEVKENRLETATERPPIRVSTSQEEMHPLLKRASVRFRYQSYNCGYVDFGNSLRRPPPLSQSLTAIS